MASFEFDSRAVGVSARNIRWLCEAAAVVGASDAFAARALLADWGLQRFVWLEQQDLRSFIAGDRRIILVALDSSDQSSLYRRLTTQPQPFAPTKLGPVNQYFWRKLALIRRNLGDTIAALGDAGQAVWLTGYGLGGALAVLLAGWLHSEAGISVQGVATFGCPRVGHREYALHYHQLNAGGEPLLDRTIRVVHLNDPLPHAPSRSGDYAAIGRKLQLGSQARITEHGSAEVEAIAAGPSDELTTPGLSGYLRECRAGWEERIRP